MLSFIYTNAQEIIKKIRFSRIYFHFISMVTLNTSNDKKYQEEQNLFNNRNIIDNVSIIKWNKELESYKGILSWKETNISIYIKPKI